MKEKLRGNWLNQNTFKGILPSERSHSTLGEQSSVKSHREGSFGSEKKVEKFCSKVKISLYVL